ncbi:PREDICTED: tetratricopeptide repeat protein 16-like [Priapulus caudatus]|uniref:Tetratricopeptide repeat protein 16-like n=1 Tax=Priapulus caudatus TaxID=37621 RepID=A0ABM1EMY5_PRICU|nr:PREDICTED: tetratricopeptide repeat protein 16-like [Priapulus caudatus]
MALSLALAMLNPDCTKGALHAVRILEASRHPDSVPDLVSGEARRARRRRESLHILTGSFQTKIERRLPMEAIVAAKAKQYGTCGASHFSSGELEMAVRCFDKAIHFDSGQVSFYVQRGEAYFRLGDVKSAIVNYRRAAAIATDKNQYR